MRETIRCCISCILPCGALDVIRIVHANGRVEEINHTVKAGEVLQAYPKHVLRKPPSASEEDEGGARGAGKGLKAVIVPPNAELQKGKIYFLMPVPSVPEKVRFGGGARRRRKKKEAEGNGGSTDVRTRLLVSDQYLTEILSEKVSTNIDRRRGRVGVWRPHLESISEASNDF